MKSFQKNLENPLKRWARIAAMTSLMGAMALTAAGCETAAEDAGDKTKNAIKEVNEAYGNVKEGVDKTKTWVNTKVDQAEQATEDVQKAAESLNNAVNSLREFTSLGEKEEPALDDQNPQTSGEAESKSQ